VLLKEAALEPLPSINFEVKLALEPLKLTPILLALLAWLERTEIFRHKSVKVDGMAVKSMLDAPPLPTVTDAIF